ncbi:MAG: uroporphyrinogen-III C-methyltransferase [Thiobacillaceae bacterium]
MNEPGTPAFTQRPHAFNWGIALGIIALVMAVAGYLASRDEGRTVRAAVSQKLTEFQASITADRLETHGAEESYRQVDQRLTDLETQLSTSKEQQLALDALYKELSRDRDQWALAEIEQILFTVNQQLLLEGNVKAAILGLETADARLARKDLPQFVILRAAIAKDLAKLRGLSQVDYTGLSIRLNSLVAGAEDWPLVSEATARKIGNIASPNKLHSFGEDLLSEIKSIVQVRRLDRGEPALLTPEQSYFLRQNLQLRLLSARLCLLNRDQANFTADIAAAEKLLARYFNERDGGVASASQELAKMSRLNISPPLPGLEASLSTLEQLRQIH